MSKDIDELNDFVHRLPDQLKFETSLYIHELTYKKIDFLQNKSNEFKAWFCPNLKPILVTTQ